MGMGPLNRQSPGAGDWKSGLGWCREARPHRQGLIIFSWATLSKCAALTLSLFDVSVFTLCTLRPGSSKATHSIPCLFMGWAERLFLYIEEETEAQRGQGLRPWLPSSELWHPVPTEWAPAWLKSLSR